MAECKTSKTSEKTDWISRAKGFGILGVVAVHTVQRFIVPSHINSVAWAGMYCVQLFFVISAYLTFMSLDKNKQPLTTRDYLKYFGHKLVRLIPVLYTAVLWHVLGCPLVFGDVIEYKSHLWKNAFFAVSFLNGFSYHYINPWANWYIGDLVIFWAVAPILFRWINTIKKSVWLFVVSMVIAWFSTIVLNKFDVDTWGFFYLWFPNQLPILAIGIMFYHFQKSSFVTSTKSILTLAFVVSTCLLLSFFFFTTPMELHVRYGLFLFVFAYSLFNNSGKWFNWLKVLGDNSYGIYLYHYCLLAIFDYVVNEFGISKESVSSFVCYYVLLVLFSLALAKMANVLFEKPFFRFMKKRFGI